MGTLHKLLSHAVTTVSSLFAAPGERATTTTASPLPPLQHGQKPPALLMMPNSHGTLAAVRALGRHGVPVTIADPQLLTIASCSRYATNSVWSPQVSDTQRFMDWLFEFGRTHEPHVLLPTCDDAAWLYGLHRAELSKYFYVAAADVQVLHQLLNKRLLAERAQRAGLLTPRTWFPSSPEDLEQVALEATFPVLVKPVTQVLHGTHSKGIWVGSRVQLDAIYRLMADDYYGQPLRDYDASAAMPMVQEFLPQAPTSIYTIAGYARDGRIIAARGARKLLQWPRRLGIGLCFEEAPLHEDLLAGLETLIRDAGYAGTFEVEFIEDGERRVLIDFNPRIYNQMAFDLARGLPLPILAYDDAIGAEPSWDKVDGSMQSVTHSAGRVYAYTSGLAVMLGAQRASGVVSKDELRSWREWYGDHRMLRVDPVADADDRLPALLDAALMLKRCARHPRHFVVSIALNK